MNGLFVPSSLLVIDIGLVSNIRYGVLQSSPSRFVVIEEGV